MLSQRRISQASWAPTFPQRKTTHDSWDDANYLSPILDRYFMFNSLFSAIAILLPAPFLIPVGRTDISQYSSTIKSYIMSASEAGRYNSHVPYLGAPQPKGSLIKPKRLLYLLVVLIVTVTAQWLFSSLNS